MEVLGLPLFLFKNKYVSKCNNCTLEEQAIINLIKNNSLIKQAEIAKQINKSIRTVKTRMVEMQDKGLIARKNGKRNGEWIVIYKNKYL